MPPSRKPLKLVVLADEYQWSISVLQKIFQLNEPLDDLESVKKVEGHRRVVAYECSEDDFRSILQERIQPGDILIVLLVYNADDHSSIHRAVDLHKQFLSLQPLNRRWKSAKVVQVDGRLNRHAVMVPASTEAARQLAAEAQHLALSGSEWPGNTREWVETLMGKQAMGRTASAPQALKQDSVALLTREKADLGDIESYRLPSFCRSLIEAWRNGWEMLGL